MNEQNHRIAGSPNLPLVGRSPRVRSNYGGLHASLEKRVKRHLASSFRKPLSRHTVETFEGALPRLKEFNRDIILDSGCGTGESTVKIAQQHPCCLVVGVDKSRIRINRALQKGPLPANAMLLRAELSDFWWLLRDARLSLQQHFLLYPNPWPKAKHLKRRWHGHPIFPVLLELGGRLELRTNWKTYADEFALAAQIAGRSQTTTASQTFQPEVPLTLFERKYLQSNHQLFRLELTLNAASTRDVSPPTDQE